ncbi:MAG: VanZ family protein [Flavobacteriales bacterium]|nr:VanZ family protein [Flavobacteriales bacterium]
MNLKVLLNNKILIISIVFLSLVFFVANLELSKSIVSLVHMLPFSDKIAHFVLYGTFAYLIFEIPQKRIKRRYLLIPLLLLGIADETVQSYFPNRTLSVMDYLADVSGILTAFYLSSSKKRKSYQLRFKLFELLYYKPKDNYFNQLPVTSKYIKQLKLLSKNSVGNKLGSFYQENLFNPILSQNNDTIYYLLTYSPLNIQHRIAILYFQLGNGKRDCSFLAKIIIGTILYPEYFLLYLKYYQKGRSYFPFYSWDFNKLLNCDINLIQNTLSR